MKNLREYITEAQQWIDSPAAGDDFAINIREECLLESHVIEVLEDAIVIEADDQMIAMLEQYGLLDEEPVDEEIRRYGAVGSSPGQGYTMAEGDIDPNRHPQTRDYGRGDDADKISSPSQTRLDDPWDAVSDKPDSVGRNPGMKDPGKYDDPWQYVQDSEQDFRRVMELAGVQVKGTEANTTDPLADKAAALAPVGADGAQEPVATVDETQAPDQHLSRIRELAGMAEEREDARGLDHAYEVHGNRHGYYVWRKSPISPLLNIGITDPRLTELTSVDPRSPGIQYYVNQHMKPVNFNSLSSGIKKLIQKRLPLQRGVHEPEKSPSAFSGTYDRDFELDVKRRLQTQPMAGPKGQLPEQQGVAEGVMSDVDMDLRHIAKTERMDALVDAMRGEFGIRTQQYLQDMMDQVENKLDRRGMSLVDMETKLGMLMDRVQEIYAGQDLDEAEYQGRKVALGKPMQGDVAKFKVYVKDPKTGNVKKVNFGDKTMRIKKSNPARRKSFRARHNCANPGPRTKARYWSCRKW